MDPPPPINPKPPSSSKSTSSSGNSAQPPTSFKGPPIPSSAFSRPGAPSSRGRGSIIRRPGPSTSTGPSATRAAGPDAPVIGTNDDATGAKASAVRAGYLTDPWVSAFLSPPTTPDSAPSRGPLMNRGYWARVTALDTLRAEFLHSGRRSSGDNESSSQRRQIICLGGGFDTGWLRYKSTHSDEEVSPDKVLWVDVDLGPVIAKKTELMTGTSEESKRFQPTLGVTTPLPKPHIGFTAPSYGVVAGDLRDTTALEGALKAVGIDFSIPTLLVSECVLIYLPKASEQALLAWIGSRFAAPALVLYEQIAGGSSPDAFGRVMLRNLAARGIKLPAIADSKEDLQGRLVAAGLSKAVAGTTMRGVYDGLPAADRARISRLELFDEFEEWNLLMEHYVFVIATGPGLSGQPGQPANDWISISAPYLVPMKTS